MAKAVKGLLLSPERLSWWGGRMVFKGSMHALMTAVLLRFPRLNTLGNNTQLDPFHRQPRQTAECPGGEGRAVIRSNRPGQPVGPKCRVKQGFNIQIVRAEYRLTAQDEPTIVVGACREPPGRSKRERITARSVARAKPTFEIGNHTSFGCVLP